MVTHGKCKCGLTPVDILRSLQYHKHVAVNNVYYPLLPREIPDYHDYAMTMPWLRHDYAMTTVATELLK